MWPFFRKNNCYLLYEKSPALGTWKRSLGLDLNFAFRRHHSIVKDRQKQASICFPTLFPYHILDFCTSIDLLGIRNLDTCMWYNSLDAWADSHITVYSNIAGTSSHLQTNFRKPNTDFLLCFVMTIASPCLQKLMPLNPFNLPFRWVSHPLDYERIHPIDPSINGGTK